MRRSGDQSRSIPCNGRVWYDDGDDGVYRSGHFCNDIDDRDDDRSDDRYDDSAYRNSHFYCYECNDGCDNGCDSDGRYGGWVDDFHCGHGGEGEIAIQTYQEKEKDMQIERDSTIEVSPSIVVSTSAAITIKPDGGGGTTLNKDCDKIDNDVENKTANASPIDISTFERTD